MTKRLILPMLAMMLFSIPVQAENGAVWTILTESGEFLTEICEEPSVGDEYITCDNQSYKITRIEKGNAYAESCGFIELPSTEWMDFEASITVSASTRRIGLYCTHSDESYEPSDGYYSTRERGTIYQVADALAEELSDKGIETTVAAELHHPHDAGAYRRSRQTAVQLLKTCYPDCLIDIHRDGIPDPSSYATKIGGQNVSKIRLLVGRGNQNAAVNKEFALMLKAVADRIYPGLIKDIYLGKGTFNQDLLPRSILFECGTYTLERERVIASMPMMADVLNRTLYGGVIGSAGRVTSDVKHTPKETAGITQGEPDRVLEEAKILGPGITFLIILLLIGLIGIAVLSTGSWKKGFHKAGRNLNEMTGGLIGKEPEDHENHEHS